MGTETKKIKGMDLFRYYYVNTNSLSLVTTKV